MLSGLVFFGFLAAFLTFMVVFPLYALVRFLGSKLGWTQGRMSRVARGFLWAALALFAILVRMGFIGAGSVAEGMEWDSPDGRYNAACQVGTEVGFFGGKRRYVEFTITELASGERVVHLEEPRSESDRGWNVRGNGKVLWTPDSKQVTFLFGEEHQREFKVP